jgi:c(7)-type cytochrome triheme protein
MVVALVGGYLFAANVRAEDKKADAQPPAAAPAAAPVAAPAAMITDASKAPEFFNFTKTGKMAPVKFAHALHGKKNDCKECHGGATPIFPQKFSDEVGMKMADMYAGKACGTCHDGKDHGANVKVFAAKTGCMKCHKK